MILYQILDQTLPVHQITDEQIKKFCEADTTNTIKLIWIGKMKFYLFKADEIKILKII